MPNSKYICIYIVHVYTKPHTLIKDETLVKDTFTSWKHSQIYGNKLFKKVKFLRQEKNSWWWNLEGICYLKRIQGIKEVLQVLVDFMKISSRKSY